MHLLCPMISSAVFSSKYCTIYPAVSYHTGFVIRKIVLFILNLKRENLKRCWWEGEGWWVGAAVLGVQRQAEGQWVKWEFSSRDGGEELDQQFTNQKEKCFIPQCPHLETYTKDTWVNACAMVEVTHLSVEPWPLFTPCDSWRVIINAQQPCLISHLCLLLVCSSSVQNIGGADRWGVLAILEVPTVGLQPVFPCCTPKWCYTWKKKSCNKRNHCVTWLFEFFTLDIQWWGVWSVTRVKCQPMR